MKSNIDIETLIRGSYSIKAGFYKDILQDSKIADLVKMGPDMLYARCLSIARVMGRPSRFARLIKLYIYDNRD